MTTAHEEATSIPSAEELQEIIRTSVDYIESWYTGDAERMRSCLHPELAKRSAMKDAASGQPVLRTTTAERMYRLTLQGEGAGLPEQDRTHEVTVLDAFRNIACVKVVSHEYLDYLHVARFDERWLIVNVLWDLLRSETTG
jgi:hypothetical protein